MINLDILKQRAIQVKLNNRFSEIFQYQQSMLDLLRKGDLSDEEYNDLVLLSGGKIHKL